MSVHLLNLINEFAQIKLDFNKEGYFQFLKILSDILSRNSRTEILKKDRMFRLGRDSIRVLPKVSLYNKGVVIYQICITTGLLDFYYAGKLHCINDLHVHHRPGTI